jgi:hypothetical protein
MATSVAMLHRRTFFEQIGFEEAGLDIEPSTEAALRAALVELQRQLRCASAPGAPKDARHQIELRIAKLRSRLRRPRPASAA